MVTSKNALQLSWEKVQFNCLKQGKSLLELSRLTGLSRTTLNNWANGKTIKPHSQKITAIAEALGVPVEDLLVNPPSSASRFSNENVQAGSVDQQYNPCVEEIAQQRPELFRHWSAKDWEELYSEFGVGGGLTPLGVKNSVEHINRKKEILRKLELILESEMSDLAEALVTSLYQKIVAAPQ